MPDVRATQLIYNLLWFVRRRRSGRHFENGQFNTGVYRKAVSVYWDLIIEGAFVWSFTRGITVNTCRHVRRRKSLQWLICWCFLTSSEQCFSYIQDENKFIKSILAKSGWGNLAFHTAPRGLLISNIWKGSYPEWSTAQCNNCRRQ